MESTDIMRLTRNAPQSPGVYTWRGTHGTPLYIGKAVDLRSRLSSYAKNANPRIQAMCNEATTVEWETVPTEIEALILESRRIKQLKPKFNIVMRDDKQYSYVGLTDEAFPQLIVTHQARSIRVQKPFKRLIGPFTDASALTLTLRWLRGPFPSCTCKQKHHLKCLNAHIGKCPGYCCLKGPMTNYKLLITNYRKNIRAVTDILDGKRDTLVRRLARTNPDIALRLLRVFENAQFIAGRRRLSARHPDALAQLADNLRLAEEPRRIEGYDIAHIQGNHAAGAMVVFTDGNPDKTQYRLFNLHGGAIGDTAQLKQVLERRLNHDEWPLPDLILVDGGRAQLNTMTRTLDAHNHHIPVIALTKDDHHQADHILSSLDSQVRMLTDIPRPMSSLVVHIDTEAHRFAIGQYRRRHRRSLVE